MFLQDFSFFVAGRREVFFAMTCRGWKLTVHFWVGGGTSCFMPIIRDLTKVPAKQALSISEGKTRANSVQIWSMGEAGRTSVEHGAKQLACAVCVNKTPKQL
jgi:hypothetical protein